MLLGWLMSVIILLALCTFVQTLAVPGDPALDAAVLRAGLQHELVEVVGAGHVQCPLE